MALKQRIQPKRELFDKLAGRQFYYHKKPDTIYTISNKVHHSGQMTVHWDDDTDGQGAIYSIKSIIERIKEKDWILINK